mmetsp:Transcript_70636/g.169270  ORF Transcript_70636/g.169270 Transcript_70636/m.169270 type:complete len:290 (+) Transcript_70636:580-1449(+)
MQLLVPEVFRTFTEGTLRLHDVHVLVNVFPLPGMTAAIVVFMVLVSCPDRLVLHPSFFSAAPILTVSNSALLRLLQRDQLRRWILLALQGCRRGCGCGLMLAGMAHSEFLMLFIHVSNVSLDLLQLFFLLIVVEVSRLLQLLLLALEFLPDFVVLLDLLPHRIIFGVQTIMAELCLDDVHKVPGAKHEVLPRHRILGGQVLLVEVALQRARTELERQAIFATVAVLLALINVVNMILKVSAVGISSSYVSGHQMITVWTLHVHRRVLVSNIGVLLVVLMLPIVVLPWLA